VEVWQTSNLRRLRLGEEKRRRRRRRRRTNHSMKIYMVSLFHRATIKEERKKEEDRNHRAKSIMSSPIT